MSRHYKYMGRELPTVTTIISDCTEKPALTRWAANCACDYILEQMPKMKSLNGYTIEWPEMSGIIESARSNYRQVSHKALNIGSQVHDAIERYFKTSQEPHNLPDEGLSAFIAFLEWKDEYKVEAIATEHTIYGPNYAGTCDLICRMDIKGERKKYLMDFKTSKALYVENRYQVAAYRAVDPTIEGCGVLRLDKETGEPEWKDTSKTYENDLRVFQAMVNLFFLRHPIIAKKAGVPF